MEFDSSLISGQLGIMIGQLQLAYVLFDTMNENEFFVQPEEEVIEASEQERKSTADRLAFSQKISLKMVPIQRTQQQPFKPFRMNKPLSESSESEEEVEDNFSSPFTQYYHDFQCVYQKYDNSSVNKLKAQVHFSGTFVSKQVFSNNQISHIFDLPSILKHYYEVSQGLTASKGLVFDSRFQSGNLFAAFKIGGFQYDLILEQDTNSQGNKQWFYFSVSGMIPQKEYTFNIVNFTKNDSLFNYGLKPVVYCNGVWKRMGKHIQYKKGHIRREHSKKLYYKLCIKLQCPSKGSILIAHSYPYTYSHLKNYMNSKLQCYKAILSKRLIGKTVSKKDLECLIIAQIINKKRDMRKAVVIMARQHPGETQGSYVCEGIIQKLLDKSKQSYFLRSKYVFYVIPMVNPDGVIFGHYRTNLLGKDLNRKWDCSQKQTVAPQILCVRSFLQQISKQRQVRFILDLHGHSKKLNSFFYGNSFLQSPELVRIFPFACSKLNPAIKFSECTFDTEAYQRKIARVYLRFAHKLIHVYTFESSFYGFQQEGKIFQFTPKEYRSLGSSLVNALHLQLEHEIRFQESFSFDLDKNLKNREYRSSLFVRMLKELKGNKLLLDIGNIVDSGSESHPQDGQINLNDVESCATIIVPSKNDTCSNQRSYYSHSSKQRKYGASKQKRNIRVLEMSRINSVFPDSFNYLGLQPMSVPKEQPKQKRIERVSTDCQTQKEYNFQDLEPEEIMYSQTLSDSLIFRNPQSSAHKSSFKVHNKNSIIFKIDLTSYRLKGNHSWKTETRKVGLKYAYSQTLISFQKSSERLNSARLRKKLESTDKWRKKNYETVRVRPKQRIETAISRHQPLMVIATRPLQSAKKQMYRKRQ